MRIEIEFPDAKRYLCSRSAFVYDSECYCGYNMILESNFILIIYILSQWRNSIKIMNFFIINHYIFENKRIEFETSAFVIFAQLSKNQFEFYFYLKNNFFYIYIFDLLRLRLTSSANTYVNRITRLRAKRERNKTEFPAFVRAFQFKNTHTIRNTHISNIQMFKKIFRIYQFLITIIKKLF